MRKIYLFRHAMPDFPEGVKYCLGTTDMPLGIFGRMQAYLTAEGIEYSDFHAVFCSNLSRSRETAEFFTASPIPVNGFEEMSAGAWDGLPFSGIKELWPEIYEARGKDFGVPIPGAEDPCSVQKRFMAALLNALKNSNGDIAVIGHSTCIQSLICSVMGIDPREGRQFHLPYCSCCVFTYDGEFHMESMGKVVHPALTRKLCEKLLEAACVPAHIRHHCTAVADQALGIHRELAAAGCMLDAALLESSAMLHDMARLRPHHGQTAAKWLDGLGYPQHAAVIRQHHNLDRVCLNEAAVVFIADKITRETSAIPLLQRFEQSQKKCLSPKEKDIHTERLKQALEIQALINKRCEKEVIV